MFILLSLHSAILWRPLRVLIVALIASSVVAGVAYTVILFTIILPRTSPHANADRTSKHHTHAQPSPAH